ncbi:hypothetical protein NC651_012727 [Populus alba x Populus x berolinensis]|nr:hypothetical protein NC651_012727 [Populus alba x Populus x berolinensis]
MMEGDAAMVRIQRKSSMESEPRTLTMDQIQFARVYLSEGEGLGWYCSPTGSTSMFGMFVGLMIREGGVISYSEAALYVVNTRSIEEALSIFTENNYNKNASPNIFRFRARGRTKWRQNDGYEQRNAVFGRIRAAEAD